MTLGKSIGGGVPIGAYGVTAELADRIAGQQDADYEDTGGVGGTLAGNALSLAAARATLGEVLTDEAFRRMVALRERFRRRRRRRSPSTGCRGRWSRSAPAAIPLLAGAAAHRRGIGGGGGSRAR